MTDKCERHREADCVLCGWMACEADSEAMKDKLSKAEGILRRYPEGWSEYRRATAARTCPACRGYDLERQWCSVCDGRGRVIARQDAP